MGTGSVVKCHFSQGSSMWWPLVNPGAVGWAAIQGRQSGVSDEQTSQRRDLPSTWLNLDGLAGSRHTGYLEAGVIG